MSLRRGDRVRWTPQHLERLGLLPHTADARAVGVVLSVEGGCATVRWTAEAEGEAPVEALAPALRNTFSNPPCVEAK